MPRTVVSSPLSAFSSHASCYISATYDKLKEINDIRSLKVLDKKGLIDARSKILEKVRVGVRVIKRADFLLV